MALLCVAQLMVRLPFNYWRAALGRITPENESAIGTGTATIWTAGPARRLAVHVERGAERLPFTTKCLPRAMALCWLLRARRIAYVMKIAARPDLARRAGAITGEDNLHAWVESGGSTVIGGLPGPWLVVLVLCG